MGITFTASKTEANVGETLTFTITSSNLLKDLYFDIKLNGSAFKQMFEVPNNTSRSFTHTFNSVGTYVFSGRDDYEGYDLPPLTVTVSDAPTHDYDLSFDESSYETCNGSVTVTATLTDNGTPIASETISLTGTGSTVTATTDNNGVATFSLTGINENKTLTATFGNVSDTVNVVYNDTSTLNGSLVCLGKKMASNLRSMGVNNASASDGLSTLAEKILNIDPSIGGIDFDTSITCVASSNNVDFGDTVTFSGTLEADYNDTSQADVDLEGFLSGATVKIYDGQTLLGTAVTDSNGAYSFQYTTTYDGTLSIVAYFDGTTYYDACHSNSVSVVVNPIVQLSVTADKPVLSAYDSETATITATLTQSGSGYEGETLTYQIKQGSTVIDSGSDTTDANGEISFNYAATGIGNVDVIVTYGILLEEIYELEDCIYFHTMTSADSTHWTIPSNANASYNSNGMKLSGSGWADSYLEIPLTKPYSVEFDITEWSSSPSYLHYFWDSTKTTRHLHMGRSESVTYFDVYPSTSNNLTYNIPQNCHIKFEINNDNAKLYVDNDVKLTKSYTMPSTSKLGLGKSSESTTRWKNIKIKPL